MDLRRPILAIYLLLLACSFVQSELRGRRAPILRQPKGTATTGCYFVVFKDKTKEGEMEQAMATISKYADNSRIYSVVKRVSKAITVKLSPIALELVNNNKEITHQPLIKGHPLCKDTPNVNLCIGLIQSLTLIKGQPLSTKKKKQHTKWPAHFWEVFSVSNFSNACCNCVVCPPPPPPPPPN